MATIQPFPVVREGARGQRVLTLQFLLRARRHTVAADSIFGPATAAAVRAFQKERNLTVDGVVGPRTWAAVIVTVRRGNAGDAVRAAQSELQFRDQNPPLTPVVDGDFGPATEAAVRSFQTGLRGQVDTPVVTVDGIVGPVTWQGLISGALHGA